MSDTKTRPSADPTRAAILKNAKKLFVKKGFAGTSISEIAKAARINQSLIYHHFKNKEDLWISVKHYAKEAYDTDQHILSDDVFAIDNAEEFLKVFIAYRFGIYDANPDIRRMIDWQYLEPATEKLIGFNPEFLEQVRTRIKDFQKQGQITNTTNPDLILTMVNNATTGFWRSHTDLEKSVSKEEQRALKQEYLRLCINSLLFGLVGKNQLQ